MQDKQPFPLNTLPSMQDGQTIGFIRGVLVKIFPQKSGTHSNGEWSIQNGTIRDASGTEVDLFIKDRREIPQDVKGKTIEITAANSKQHGLTGIKVMDDDFKGNITRKLKITASATIEQVADGVQSTKAPQGAEQEIPLESRPDVDWDVEQHGSSHSIAQEQAEFQAKMEAERQRKAQQQPDPLHESKLTIVQIANLHVLCRMAVERQEAPLVKKLTGRDMGEQEIQSATASLFIKADKLGMHSRMPTRPFKPEDFGS